MACAGDRIGEWPFLPQRCRSFGAASRFPGLFFTVSVLFWASGFNGALIQIIMASRVLYGMGSLGWLPSALARLNTTTRTPLNATALVSLAVLLFALWLPILSLAKLTRFIILFIFILVDLSLFIIKRRQATPAGIISVPLWVPMLGFVLSSLFVVYQLWQLVSW